MDKETQQLKVQLLDLQRAYLQLSIENSTMKLEKLEPMYRQEKMILMSLEKNELSQE
jgi:hypothetical protein